MWPLWGNDIRNELLQNDFFHIQKEDVTKEWVKSFSNLWLYCQNQILQTLYPIQPLIHNLTTTYETELYRLLVNNADGEVENLTQKIQIAHQLNDAIAEIIRDELGGEQIEGEQSSQLPHNRLLEAMYESFGRSIDDIRMQWWNPLDYQEMRAFLDATQDKIDLTMLIASMEVLENFAKQMFESMDTIYHGYKWDRRSIDLHIMIEEGHGEWSDDLTDLYLKLFPELTDELCEKVEEFKKIRWNVLTMFHRVATGK